MKKTGIIALFLLLFAGALYAADEPAAQAESEDTGFGLSWSVDYYSTYLFRGTYFYGNGKDGSNGAFYPAFSWEIFGSGLSLGIAAEISDQWVVDGVKGQGFNNQSADFGLDYSHTFGELVTLDLGAWYWWYYNTKDAIGDDWSMITVQAKVSFDVILQPFICVCYDMYPFVSEFKDFYVQVGIGHDFELHKYVTLNLGLSGGFYHYKSSDIMGISDVQGTIGTTVEYKGASFYGSFNLVVVPFNNFITKGDDRVRYFANLGASYSL